MAQPRVVAVVGGGLAGTLCSLVLRNRGMMPIILDAGTNGIGGRLRGGALLQNYPHDGGAQFLRALDPRLVSVLNLLQQHSIVAQWEGRFGMLGSKHGSFLPKQVVVAATATLPNDNTESNKNDDTTTIITCANATTGGDFCGFVTHKGPVYVGIPNMLSICPRISEMAGIEVRSDSRVVGAEMMQEGGWRLQVDGGSSSSTTCDEFDALVLATHEPTLARTIILNIAQREQEAADRSIREHSSNNEISTRLYRLVDALKSVREAQKPVITFSINYPSTGLSDTTLDYDAVSVHGSPLIQFLTREDSKPGRHRHSGWTGVSTIEFAEYIMNQKNHPESSSSADQMLANEFTRLTGLALDDDDDERVSSRLWRAGFQGKSLNLLEDSVTLSPWRLCVCGDYIGKFSRHATPLEAAALSGLEAGERVASFFV